MSPHKPQVSVVIPVYNRAGLVARAIESVLGQSYQPLEVIVVDDGSTDGTLEVVRRMSEDDDRIVLLKQAHGGAPRARNLGIEKARGSHVAFQDSDDVWLPDFLSTLVDCSQDPRVVCFCSFERVSAAGDVDVLPQVGRIRFVKHRLRSGNVISTQTALVPRPLLDEFRFDTSLPRLQDWDLWLSMSKSVDFHHVDKVLARQYLQGDSISANPDALVKGLRALLRKHWRRFLLAPLALIRNLVFALRGA